MQLFFFLLISSVVGMTLASFWISDKREESRDEKLYRMLLKEAERRRAEGGETIPKLAESMGLKTYVEYLTKARLVSQLETTGPFTAFAPTDKVFENLPEYVKTLLKNETSMERIMKYSVMTGELKDSNLQNDLKIPTLLGGEDMIRINKYKNDKVITASGRIIKKMPGETATNGMVYEMEGLPQPPMGKMSKSMAECPVFKMLTKALNKAKLAEMLMGEGPFTVFAPTDDAFMKIPEKTRDDLMKNETALKETLMYHVMKGTFYTAAWTTKDTITMASGKTATVTMESDKWMVNSIPMTTPDNTCVNGVVHVIEEVMMPPTARLELVFDQ